MEERERNKCDQYKKVGWGSGDLNVVPFVMDITGNIGKRGIEFINTLSNLTKDTCPEFGTRLYRRINVALARGLAKTVIAFNRYLDEEEVFNEEEDLTRKTKKDLPVPFNIVQNLTLLGESE